jgi:hypothetical protein
MGGRAARLTLLAVTGALALVAPSAQAGIPGPTVDLGHAGGFEYKKAPFEDVVSQAGAPVLCDSGDTPTGGGGTISGSGKTAALNSSYPNTGPPGAFWHAEGSTSSTPRTVTTYVICGPADLSYSHSTSPVSAVGNPGDVVPLSDSCDGNEIALGGVRGEGGDVRILATRVTGGGSALSSTVENFADVSANASQYYACTEAYDPSQRTASVKVPSGKARKATTRCHSDEAVIGGGLTSTSGGEPAISTWATWTRPFDSNDKKRTPDDGWQVKLQNDSQGGNKLKVYALCEPR